MSNNFEEFEKAGDYLLEELQSFGMISESFVRAEKAKQAIQLNEDVKRSTPYSYYMQGRDQVIHWDRFEKVYKDYMQYPDFTDVMRALGIPVNLWSNEKSARRAFERAIQHFQKEHPNGRTITTLGQREKYRDGGEGGDMPTADIANVDGGRKGKQNKSTRVVNVLNDRAVVPGEFYSDISRIPKRRWGSFIRFWERQVSRIKNPKSILGRNWSMHFIMGYQFQKNVVIEIWYSSATSDFNVYDQNGVALSTKGFPSLQEGIRLFVTYLLRQYETDKEVFKGSSTSASELARSYMNALTRGVAADAAEKKREAELMDRETKRKSLKGSSITGTISNATRFRYNDTVEHNNEARDKRKERSRELSTNTQSNKDAWDADHQKNRAAARQSMKDKAASILNRKHEKVDPFIDPATDAKFREDEIKRAHQRRQEEERDRRRANRTYDGEYVVRPQNQAALTKKDEVRTPSYNPFNQSQIPANELRRYYDEYMQARADYEAELSEIRRMEAEQRELEKMQSNSKSSRLGDRFTTLTNGKKREIERAKGQMSQYERAMKSLESKLKKNGIDVNNRKMVKESFGDEFGDFEFDAEDRQLEQNAMSLRQMAKNSGFTTTAIKTSLLEDMITVYNETKAKHRDTGIISRFLNNKVFRGRAAAIEEPIRKAGWYDRMKMAILGVTYRADFVIGFSLKDAINIEVWYLTEPDPKNPTKSVSSFYVYDLTAKKIVRSHLPYYRSALQVVLAKIGVSE